MADDPDYTLASRGIIQFTAGPDGRVLMDGLKPGMSYVLCQVTQVEHFEQPKESNNDND